MLRIGAIQRGEVCLRAMNEARGVYYFPGRIVTQNAGDERSMNSVSRSFRFDAAKQGHSEKREISDNVDDLMPNNLVSEAEPFAIHDSALGCKHDCVLERPAASQPHVPQRFDLVEEAERACR